MTNQTWTDTTFDPAGVDAVEIAGCIDLGDAIERVDSGDGATLFSVYVHRTGQGAECVADRNTAEEARAYGERLAGRLGVPVVDLL